MAKVELSMEEFLQLQQLATSGGGGDCSSCPHLDPGSNSISRSKKKRKKSAYSKKYGAAFKKVQKKYKKKSGGWMKDGFKRAQKEAHKIAKRKK